MDAKFKISDVLDLNGATSIGKPSPIKRGPINFPPPNTFINFVEIAALCKAGIIKIFALPTMPNMEFSEHAIENNDKYNFNANFKVAGEWEYELMFKTSYGTIYSQEGRVTIN